MDLNVGNDSPWDPEPVLGPTCEHRACWLDYAGHDELPSLDELAALAAERERTEGAAA